VSISRDIEKQIRKRMSELQPQVDEYDELAALLASLREARSGTSTSNVGPPPPGCAKRRGSQPRGRRADEAIERIRLTPGITVGELARAMGIGPTYLYKLLPALERAERITKVGTGYELVPQRAL